MRKIKDKQLTNLLTLVNKIAEENDFQLKKRGVQEATPAEWMLHLSEEFGELAKAIKECEYRGASKTEVVKEAIQTATLTLKIAEMYL